MKMIQELRGTRFLLWEIPTIHHVVMVNMNLEITAITVTVSPQMHTMMKLEAAIGYVILATLKEMITVPMKHRIVALDNILLGIIVTIVRRNHQAPTTQAMERAIGAVQVDTIVMEIHV